MSQDDLQDAVPSTGTPAKSPAPPGFVGSRAFKLALIAVLFVGVYAIFGFLAAPKWLRAAATQGVDRSLGVPLGLGEIRLNPFLLQLEIDDISLPDAAAAEPLVAVDRLFVDFELASIWNRALVFKDIALDGPFARVIILPDTSLNLAALVPPPDPQTLPAPEGEDSGLPAMWIQQLAVSDGRVNFADRSRRMAPEKQIAPIEFALRDFRTTPEGGVATLDARSEDAEGVEWQGRIALAPFSSDGRFSVTRLKARTVWEFLSEELPLELTDGSIDLTGSYDFTLDPETRVTLTLPTIGVNDLTLRALDTEEAWVTIPSISIADTAVSTAEQSVRIARVAIERPVVEAWLEPDGSLNLARLAGPPNDETAPAALASEAPTAEPQALQGDPAPVVAHPADEPVSAAASSLPIDAAGEPPARAMPPETPVAEPPVVNEASASSTWTVELVEFALNEAAIDFEDRTFTPANPTKIAPLSVTATGLSLDLARRIALSLAATINDRGKLTLTGDLAPQPLSGDLDVRYEDGSLTVGQPYISRVAAVTVKSGRFDVDGRLALRPEGGDEPWMRFGGAVTAQTLNTVDNEEQRDLLNFERLELNGIEFALGPDALVIDEVLVTQPFARVIIAPDQTVNVVEVFETSDSKREADAEAPPGEAPQTAAAESFPVAIGKVRIQGGTLDFSDFYIEPNFQATIDSLNGHIEALSSDPASRATIDLKGQVISEFSPVSITGTMNLFSFDRFTDIDLEFRNIDLPVFNPYSGRFAGYAIAKGKLTTELSYLIEERRLDAQHHVVLDQLEWGEATGSKDAVSIPLKLATALLKDRDGVIDLEFPVGGSLDDPAFRLGPVIWQVIRNLLVKIVTAPFAFIGSLFAGAEDAQFVTFAPGSAELTVENADSLAALAKALLERPQLKLDVPVRRMPEVDGPALAAQRYRQEVETAARIATGAAADAPVDVEALDPQTQLEVLTMVYTVFAGAPPTIPEAPSPPDGTSRGDAKALATRHAIDYLDEASRSLIAVTDEALLKLAEARAQAIQRTLLGAAAIDAERVFITSGDKVTIDGDQVKLELGLE